MHGVETVLKYTFERELTDTHRQTDRQTHTPAIFHSSPVSQILHCSEIQTDRQTDRHRHTHLQFSILLLYLKYFTALSSHQDLALRGGRGGRRGWGGGGGARTLEGMIPGKSDSSNKVVHPQLSVLLVSADVEGSTTH